MFKRIDHIEITTGNLEKTISFYTDILGFKIKQRNKMDRPPLEEIDYLTLGDTMIEVLSVKEPAPLAIQQWQVGYRMMALEVENMDEAIEYLKSKGVEISQQPRATGASKRAEIKDPDGRSIELRQWG
ncbi:MAG: VOC family protein [Dehalococcoidales bacterium]|nr:VOC family protein [Dehalococcoidales bacterium]